MRQRFGQLRVARGAVVGLCAAAALTHMTMVFLHVAPSNPVSQRYEKQITAWISPFFEQNWLLFAPNPSPDQLQIYARTGWTTADGGQAMSDWVDISAADREAVSHNPYPSRTNHTMLLRAWIAYQSEHGEDDVSYDDQSRIRADYLRNIAAQRLAEIDPRQPFEVIRIKVVQPEITMEDPGGAPQTGPAPPYTRTLPWWKVTSDGS
ncbi:DUF5819 family protein [Actinoplanes subglobosus]|uniref:DUF5819 family protein n=1 Tax=Actinoplanes subglobosus TaxID=1547892 RepID=A0ABV8IZ19_9ACTN